MEGSPGVGLYSIVKELLATVLLQLFITKLQLSQGFWLSRGMTGKTLQTVAENKRI